MNVYYLILIILLLPFYSLHSATINDKVVFPDREAAKQAIRKPSAFFDNLSQFDRSARMKTSAYVGRNEFIGYVTDQVLPWKKHEIKKLKKILNDIDSRLTGYDLPLPSVIPMIKTTGEEEGHAPYCRGSSIILPVDVVKASAKTVEPIIIHELLHLITTYNEGLMERLYRSIGFKPCPELAFPEALAPLKITNPDSLNNDHYIEVYRNNAMIKVMPILYAAAPYDENRGGSFFDYLQCHFLEVRIEEDRCLPVYGENEELNLFNLHGIINFYEQIGMNTRYIIHPEEILADNFMLLITNDTQVPSPEILSRMRAILQ